MDVRDAVASRYSCRAFLPTPVAEAIVREIIERAARAPSGGNLQAWRIYAIAGARVEELKALLSPRTGELPKGEGGEYQIFPTDLKEPYRSRRFGVGELLYRSIGVPGKIARHVTGNTPGTFSSSAHRSGCFSQSTKPCCRRNGLTSGALSRPSWCLPALMGFTPARRKRGSPGNAPCVLFWNCRTNWCSFAAWRLATRTPRRRSILGVRRVRRWIILQPFQGFRPDPP